MLNKINWQPLQQRRKIKRLTHFFKAANNLSPVEIPEYVSRPVRHSTRSHDQAYIQLRASTDQYKNSFLPRTIRDWNALSQDLVQSKTADEFSSRLQRAAA